MAQQKNQNTKGNKKANSKKNSSKKTTAKKTAIKKTQTKKNVKKVAKKQIVEYNEGKRRNKTPRYLQNRELSWLKFNERVLEQGYNKDNPLLERLNFTSIFSSNLQEFYMVRVGSITDLSFVDRPITDNKSGMTPRQQINAINKECARLCEKQEYIFSQITEKLAKKGIEFIRGLQFTSEHKKFLKQYAEENILPYISPQIVNAQHPFPHLENGDIYIIVELQGKERGLGIIPLPKRCQRIIELPTYSIDGDERIQYTLLEQVIEYIAKDVFSMYKIKHTNIISVTRNADLDVIEGSDEVGNDFREHMKRILKRRTRLAPVRLVSEMPIEKSTRDILKRRLRLREDQMFTTKVPLDMSYCSDLQDLIPAKKLDKLKYKKFTPQWPATIDKNKSFMSQIRKQDFLLKYPYESFDPMVKLVREAALDPKVVSIRITLYRLAKESRLAEALIAAAEAGKDVVALFELRARFDENNNIKWSQRFEEAGAKVLYGFEEYKVHSKVCSIVRRKSNGKVERFTQFGTGNYNETTSKLYTDMAYFTSKDEFGQDAEEFFRNMSLENISDNYQLMRVAPMQIKQMILKKMDEQIERKKQGLPCGIFFKTNSITDIGIIRKIVQASKAGVKTTILCRGISCIVPGLDKFTENVEVVSIVGRLLEHSRIYGFGDGADMDIYLSSADLMARNMSKRVEVAWPVLDETLRLEVIYYIYTCLTDTAKLRRLLPDGNYTEAKGDEDSQERLIAETYNEKYELAKLSASESSSSKPEKKKKRKHKIILFKR